MPVELAADCLRLTCRPGGTTIDPFGGSGTVSVVAKRLGLMSVYVDRHLPFVEEAKRRVSQTTRQRVDFANDDRPIDGWGAQAGLSSEKLRAVLADALPDAVKPWHAN